MVRAKRDAAHADELRLSKGYRASKEMPYRASKQGIQFHEEAVQGIRFILRGEARLVGSRP